MAYTLPAWADSPSTASPLSAANFGQVNTAVQDLDSRDTVLETAVAGVHVVGNSGSTLTINVTTTGAVKRITLNTDCTVTLTGATSGKRAAIELALTQDATGGRTVTWPTSVKWSGGAPILSLVAGAVDRVALTSYDGGTTWYGNIIGKGYVTVEPQGGTSLFTDDFATGNFSKWGFLEWNTGGTIRQTAGTSYSGTGEYSAQIVSIDGRANVARFELRDGDIPFGSSERAEISRPIPALSVDAVPGDARWIAWDMKFHASWPVPHPSSNWMLFWQWHQATGTASPALTLDIDTDDVVYLANNDSSGGFQRTAVQAMVRDTWQRWVVHARFSEDPAVGYAEVWVDGVQKISHEFRRTLVPGDTSCYLKTGLYRDAVNTATAIHYIDNYKITSP